MENEELEVVAPEATEEAAPEAEEGEESVEEVKARLAKAEELANNYKIRAEKAEKASKQVVKAPEQVSDGMSTKDTIAIMNAKVHEDDVDEIVDFAKYKGISVSDALKSDVIKTILSTKAEQRTVAEATNTGASRRGSAKVSDETLISNASAGKIPESDDEIERLIRAKLKANQ